MTNKTYKSSFSVIKTVISCLFIVMLTACSFQTIVPPANNSPHRELFTLETGKYWSYQIHKGDEQATVKNVVADSKWLGDTQWFLLVEYGEKFWVRNTAKGQVEAVNLYSKEPDDLIFVQLDPKAVREELIFKFPARPGDSWITLENNIRYEGVYSKTVPAGIYHCHLYSISRYGEIYSHSCIAEDIGVIYSDNLLESGEWEVSELESWGKEE